MFEKNPKGLIKDGGEKVACAFCTLVWDDITDFSLENADNILHYALQQFLSIYISRGMMLVDNENINMNASSLQIGL